jgi:hypothetical protein
MRAARQRPVLGRGRRSPGQAPADGRFAPADRIVFFTGPGMRKARNLRRDARLALSIAPVDNPFEPVAIRGRVVEWIDGDAAWAIIDQLATKYTGQPYPRTRARRRRDRARTTDRRHWLITDRCSPLRRPRQSKVIVHDRHSLLLVTEAQALKLAGPDQLRDAGLNDRSKYLNQVQVLGTH